jgi:GMP synthase (glutamine-hydrolysing)
MNLIYVNAEKEFLRKLANVSDPEKKRKIIGNCLLKYLNVMLRRLKT